MSEVQVHIATELTSLVKHCTTLNDADEAALFTVAVSTAEPARESLHMT